MEMNNVESMRRNLEWQAHCEVRCRRPWVIRFGAPIAMVLCAVSYDAAASMLNRLMRWSRWEQRPDGAEWTPIDVTGLVWE